MLQETETTHIDNPRFSHLTSEEFSRVADNAGVLAMLQRALAKNRAARLTGHVINPLRYIKDTRGDQ